MKISLSDFGVWDGWPILILKAEKEERVIYLAPPIIRSLNRLKERGSIPAQRMDRQVVADSTLFNQTYDSLNALAYQLLNKLESRDDSAMHIEHRPLTLSDIKRAGQEFAGRHSIAMWQLIGYVPLARNYVGAYLQTRQPLSFIEVSEYYRQLGFVPIQHQGKANLF